MVAAICDSYAAAASALAMRLEADSRVATRAIATRVRALEQFFRSPPDDVTARLRAYAELHELRMRAESILVARDR